jgi:hypothetical protein
MKQFACTRVLLRDSSMGEGVKITSKRLPLPALEIDPKYTIAKITW